MSDPGLLSAAAAAAGALLAIIRWWKARGPRETYRLVFPRELPAEALVASLRALHGILPPLWGRLLRLPAVVLEAIGTAEGIAHYLTVGAAEADQVLGQLRATLPGIRIERTERKLPRVELARVLEATGRGLLRTDQTPATNTAILAALQPAGAGGMVVVQWVLLPVGADPLRRAARLLDVLRGIPPTPPRTGRPTEPVFAGRCRVGASGPGADRLIARMVGALATASTEDRLLSRRIWPPGWTSRHLALARVPIYLMPAALAGDEVAAALGVPVDGPQLDGLTLSGTRRLPVMPAVPRFGRVLGDGTAGGLPRPVALTEAESARGLLITSPTGSGKSTLLEHLCAGDFAAGRGVVVIESKGDLVRGLADLVPRDRLDDVVVFDPADARPVGFNLLTAGDEAAELIVEHTVRQFTELSSYFGPRSEMLLRAALLSLTAAEGQWSLCEVMPLLTDPAFRRRIVGQSTDDALAGVWGWFEGQSEAAQTEMTSPLLNKLAPFMLRPRLRSVVGQTERGLDLPAVLAGGKIALISLSKGTIGEDAASLIGSCILARLWAAIQARAALEPSQRRFVSVVLDEAQDFLRLPVALGDAVAQSRGMNVGWTVAHQHLGQLAPETRRAVTANLRSKLVMQTTADDAQAFAREFSPFVTADDLRGLGPFEGYAQVSVGAAVAPPCSITTRPAPPRVGLGESVRERSRERHGAAREDVAAALRARLERPASEPKVGRRRRP